MFAGRNGIVAAALLLLTPGVPLGAAEPIGELAEPACPDEVAASAKSDDKSYATQYLRQMRRTVEALSKKSEDEGYSHRRQVHRRGFGTAAQAPQPLPYASTDEVAVPTGDRSPPPWKDGLYMRDPVVERSTLAEVMRRVALWGDGCPLCGQSRTVHDADEAEESPPKAVTRLRRMFNEGRVDCDDDAVQPKSGATLRTGEPAQVILDTQKRLGRSVLDGTEFGGSPETLIQWIRALDEESRRRQALLDEPSRRQVEVVAEQELLTAQSQVESLRTACRHLQEAADALEEQNLFESADSVRHLADQLRRESRRKVSRENDRPAPTVDDDG